MRSLRTKFVLLILLTILSCVVIVGSISIWNINREEEYASTQIINTVCRELAAQLNHQIDTLASSVNTVASIAVDEAGSVERLRQADERKEFLDQMNVMLRDIAQNTENSVAYYFYITPDLNGTADGFLFNRPDTDTAFTLHELTDISLYDPEDLGHVGWYYLPKNAGKPLWMEPYHNENMGIHAISYEVPLYVEGEFIGIAGMDLDFDAFTVPVREVTVYDTGYAYLMDDEGKVYYHPVLAEGTIPSETASTLDTVISRFHEGDNGDDLITYYSYAGIERKTAFVKLHNGMNEVISADSSAIYAHRDSMIRSTVLIMVLVSALWVIVTTFITRRMTRPLTQLTDAANQISMGQLDVELPKPTHDEIGTLTRTLQVTIQYLKRYITDINTLAYRDPLTDVKNKTAYEEMSAVLTEQLRAGEARFALVVLDANGLKQINDRYGHTQGDLYLQNVSHLICDVFKHSPVYRIGGDEFVVLLEDEDYESRRELMRELERKMKESEGYVNFLERVSIAAGMSESRRSDTSLREVFERADEAMYRRKRQMKRK